MHPPPDPPPELPAEVIPFPVKPRFVVASDMYKLGKPLFGQAEEALLHFDKRYPDFVQAKLAMLQDYPEHSRCYLESSLSETEQCLWEFIDIISEEQSDYIYSDKNSFGSNLLGIYLTKQGELSQNVASSSFPDLARQCFEHLSALTPFEKLCDLLALSLQEDLAIMHKTGEGATEDRAECLLVALPTHWDPKEKIGLDFGAIHKPIAHSDQFNKSQANLMKAMTYKGPFVRYNWGLSSSDALSLNTILMGNHTLAAQDLPNISDPEKLIDRLYFRTERQTLMPFPHLHRSIFAIRIFQQPLREALHTAERKEVFAKAVASMSPEILQYRGMTAFVKTLLQAF